MNSTSPLGAPELILIFLVLGVVVVMVSLVVGLIISLARSSQKAANMPAALTADNRGTQR